MKNILTPGGIATVDPKDVSAVAPAAMTDDQKKLKALIERRHPAYSDASKHWQFLDATYEGGRAWFNEDNIFRYVKEGDGEYRDRLRRCYRFNHSREVVDLLNKYLFKQNITRSDDAPESVKQFWNKATKDGLTVKDFSRQVGKKTSIYGRVGVVVDNTNTGGAIVSKADEKQANIRTYAYIVTPIQILDYAYDDDGDLNWILISEVARDDADPMSSSGAQLERWRLWTKNEWHLFERQKRGRRDVIVEIGQGAHNLGEVPVIFADHIISDEKYVAPSLIDDIAYLDRAVANYLSNLDEIIQDQTFSQLVMPAQNVMPGDDNYAKLVEMGTKRTFLYDGEGGRGPEYISPDPRQAQLILSVINKIINEIYHTVGLAGERTKQDNALGIDNSSGVAKAYDFERVNALLQAKADSLEAFESKLARLVALWNGDEGRMGEKSLISYPDNFDTRGLYDEFDIAARLSLVDAPQVVRQEQMKMLIDKLFPQLAKDIKDQMLEQLKEWPKDPIEMAAEMAAATAGTDKQALQKESDRGVAKQTISQN
ncbi:phage portal protein [Herbaspirillum huttiense]|uniref:Phage portal protein n=1 Tax=Herbaspirillum huttiense subsp. lycopersici TaxID=3074428 RepID=A0ABU2EGW5_9BURK|nr:phage portal protein [Herbaspirillum huttiense]MDR9847027.1 phage portal protein [Herbaspirillum huttiense SE1]